MNAKKAKALRRKARETTQHLKDESYRTVKTGSHKGTQFLGECTKGAYRALKSGKFATVDESEPQLGKTPKH